MSKSIISNERECIVCGTTLNLHRHHVFYGMAKRKLSEKYGCWVYLCAIHHNLSSAGVHFNKVLDTEIKQTTQIKFQQVYPELDFMKIFGRNYLK